MAARRRCAACAPGPPDRRRGAPAGLHQEHYRRLEHRCARPGLAGRRQPDRGRPGTSHQRLALAEPAPPRRAGAGGASPIAPLHGR
ncbi:hypothetical protein G6F46_015620 [Rhizopus delemar]|nr:hypothetical protein G6F46_015620 [Rhizopus delemar]